MARKTSVVFDQDDALRLIVTVLAAGQNCKVFNDPFGLYVPELFHGP